MEKYKKKIVEIKKETRKTLWDQGSDYNDKEKEKERVEPYC